MGSSPKDSLEWLFERLVNIPPGDRAAWIRKNWSGDSELVEQVLGLLEIHDQSISGFLPDPDLMYNSLLQADEDADISDENKEAQDENKEAQDENKEAQDENKEAQDENQEAQKDTSFEDAETFLASGASQSDHSLEDPDRKRVGSYHLKKEIARGGMGVVYLAQHVQLERIAAIKLLLSGEFADQEALQRFETEAKAAAQLNHVNIVKVYDYGEHDKIPYIAMEFIQGGTLAEQCQSGPLPPKQTAMHFKKIAEALDLAHRRDVLHRDLKPANILIDQNDEPKVTDFGLAKLSASESEVTRSDQLMGTPSYMSPEQARADQNEIGPLSDVYSLGATLYFCLTGSPPFQGATWVDTLRLVGEKDPVPPRELNSSIPKDLETICLKCLEKDPTKRLRSGQELSDELTRFLNNKPIRSRPPDLWERLRKWCQRNPSIAALILVFLIGFVTTAYFYLDAKSEWTRAEKNLKTSKENEKLAGEKQKEAEEAQQVAEEAQAVAEERLLQAEANQAASTFGKLHSELKQNRQMPPSIGSIWNRSFPMSQQSWDYHYLNGLSIQNRLKEQFGRTWGQWGLIAGSLSPDGSHLMTADAAGLVLLWDWKKGSVIKEVWKGRFDAKNSRWIHAAQVKKFEVPPKWDPVFTDLKWMNNQQVLFCDLAGRVILIDVENLSGEQDNPGQQHLLQTEQELWSLDLSSDRTQLLTGGKSGILFLYNFETEKHQQLKLGESGVSITFWSKEMNHWVIGREDGTLQILDTKGKLVTENRLAGPIWDVESFQDPDQQGKTYLAIGCQEPVASVFEWNPATWELANKQTISLLSGESMIDGIHQIGFNPHNNKLYLTDNAGFLHRWKIRSPKVEMTLHAVKVHKGHGLQIDSLSPPFRRNCSALWFPSEEEVTAIGDNSAIIRWQDLLEEHTRFNRTPDLNVGPNPQVLFDRANHSLAWILDEDGTLSLLDTREDRILSQKRSIHQGGYASLAAIPETKVIATTGGDHFIRFWKSRKGTITPDARKTIEHRLPLLSVAVSPFQTWIAAVDTAGTLIVWDFQTYEVKLVHQIVAGDKTTPLTGRVAFNHDETRLAAYGPGQTMGIFVCNPQTHSFQRIEEQPFISGLGGIDLLWSPNERHPHVLYSVFQEKGTGSVRSFGKRTTLNVNKQRFKHQSTGHALAFTPDQKRVILVDDSGLIHFHDADHHLNTLTIQSGLKSLRDAAVDPTGRRLLLSNREGKLEIWETDRTLPPQPVIAPDESDRWTEHEIVKPAEELTKSARKCFRLDEKGNFHLLYVENDKEKDFREWGALYYVTNQSGTIIREPIRTEKAKFDRTFSHFALGLWVDHEGTPQIMTRHVPAIDSPYDGRLRLGTRTGSGKWNFSVVHPHGNSGFYPAARLSPQGKVQELFHYSFDGHRFLKSSPQKHLQPWEQTSLGWRGDAHTMEGQADRKGNLHLLYHYLPHNYVGTRPEIYARWDGEELYREVLPHSFQLSGIRLLDESPCVMNKNDEKWSVMKWMGPKQWEKRIEIPENCSRLKDWCFDQKGDLHLLSWDSLEKRVLLWKHHSQNWTISEIARILDIPEHPPQQMTHYPGGLILLLRINSSGQMAVLMMNSQMGDGWIKVLTSHKAAQ